MTKKNCKKEQAANRLAATLSTKCLDCLRDKWKWSYKERKRHIGTCKWQMSNMVAQHSHRSHHHHHSHHHNRLCHLLGHASCDGGQSRRWIDAICASECRQIDYHYSYYYKCTHLVAMVVVVWPPPTQTPPMMTIYHRRWPGLINNICEQRKKLGEKSEWVSTFANEDLIR